MSDHAAESAATFRKVSNTIHDTVLKGVVRGCARLSAGLKDGQEAPFEILLVGGDDAIVMLRAQDVFRFLKTFLENFRAQTTLEGLDFAVGVVWARHHFPIAQYLVLAEELLGLAKRKGGFAVDYTIVTEALAGDVGPRGSPHSKKPYVLDEFLQFEKTLRDWKRDEMPSVKVRELYRVAYQPEPQRTLDYCFLLSRLDRQHRTMMQKQFPGGAIAGAADLAELWDFVEAG